jgi:ribosomal protein S18 acetylase RimI-like enzyme
VTADRHTQDDLVQIRRAVPADAAQIADLHVRSWQGAYRDQLPQDLLDSLDPAQRVPRWTASLERASWPRAGTIVAEDARELLGFAHLCPARDDDQDSTAVGEITSIYVLPGRWDQGIGRRLMTASLATLTEAGYESVVLWVLDSNVRAIRFYEATGWHADGAVKYDELGGAPIRELRYRCDLT